jgi:hypothetical protein
MVGADERVKADDPQIQAAIADYMRYINRYFYAIDKEMLRNLADMWVADPRFAVNYERIRKGARGFRARGSAHLLRRVDPILRSLLPTSSMRMIPAIHTPVNRVLENMISLNP